MNQTMTNNSKRHWSLLFAALLCTASVTVRADEEIDANAPVVMDANTFNKYFGVDFQSIYENVHRNDVQVAGKLVSISHSGGVSPEQIVNLELAGSSDASEQARRSLDIRRQMIGKKYANLREALSEYQKLRYSDSPEPMAAGSLMRKVYDKNMTGEQQAKHEQGAVERRQRLIEASTLHMASLLYNKVTMTEPQRRNFVSAVSAELPPASLVPDDYVSPVISYAAAIIPDETLVSIFDEHQLAILKPLLEKNGTDARSSLRHNDLLKAIQQAREESRAKQGEDGNKSDNDNPV